MTLPLQLSRRRFLSSTAAATTGTVLIANRSTAFGASANGKLSLGLIGCGGRGQWIANLFAQDGGYQFVAGADYFQERVNAFGSQHNVPTRHRYTGIRAHERLLEHDVDAVVIETPPYFHPRQAADAVAAGKHVFLAKPIAVDAPGCLTIAAAGKQATANQQVFLVDFQTRASSHYRQALKMVHRGDIGSLVMVEARYPWRGGGRGLPPATLEEKLRSWYYVVELSGDFIVEQSIHALDVATWIIGADPIKAIGTGGRKVRPTQSIYDHFVVNFTFPDDLQLAFSCIQSIPEVKDEIRARAYGSDGFIDTDYFSDVLLLGKEAYRGTEPNLYTTGAQTNVREFYEAVVGGDYTNPTVTPSVRSNLTAVLGREAAYRGAEVTLQQLIREKQTLDLSLEGLKA